MFYFLKALRLYERCYVKKRILKDIGSVDGINTFYDIVEPLERALNPAYGKSSFVKLRKICPRVHTEVEPIPPKMP